jgi:uncharacterized repeat protein (TIGR03803 family)
VMRGIGFFDTISFTTTLAARFVKGSPIMPSISSFPRRRPLSPWMRGPNGIGSTFGRLRRQKRISSGLRTWLGICCAIALCIRLSATPLSAQTSTNLPTPATLAGIMQGSDGNFYSPTANGLPSCSTNYGYICGALYRTTPQGISTKGFDFSTNQGSDGAYPNPLIEGPDGSFYGTTSAGGPGVCGCGVFYKVDSSGTYTLLHTFTAADFQQTSSAYAGGALGHLVLGSDGNFYGYNFAGYAGSIFRLTPAGDFSLLQNFFGNSSTGGGFIPSGLIETTDGNFYITLQGYSGATGVYPSSGGVIYKMTATGTLTLAASFPGDGSLGFDPNGDLAQGPDGSIYGVTRGGAASGMSNALPTIYKYTPGGSIQTLYTFPASGANGSYLVAGLVLGSDGNLYGTSQYGSSTPCYQGCGTAFKVTPTGTFTLLHAFAGGVDGGSPYGPIIESSDGSIVGTNGTTVATTPGTIFSVAKGLAPPISLSLQQNGQSVGTVGSNQPITLNWQVLNAFSDTAQQCYAYQLNQPAGNTDWQGKQTGTLVNGVWTGSASFNAPTDTGVYVYALTCAGLETGQATLTVGGVSITTTSLPDATVSKPYQAFDEAIGGLTPYTWGYSGAFPAGLTLDPATGTISGTPTQFGTYQVTIGVVDSTNPQQTGSKRFQLNIASGLSLAASLNNGIVGSTYSSTAKVSGGLGPYTWALVSGNLPDGLSLNTTTGVISGKPTKADNYSFAIMVTDGEGKAATYTQSYAVSTVTPPLQITAGDFTDCTVNVLCEGQYEATGGKPPYTWSIAPGTSFPPGLTLSSTGLFTGIPKQYSLGGPFGTVGPDTLTVQVTDSSTPQLMVSDSANLSILSSLKLVSISLPVVTVGVAYLSPPPVATGGVPPYTWQISSPGNPQLVTEYARDPTTGVISSSKPVTAGQFNLIYTVSDSEGIAATSTMNALLTVVVPQTPSITTLSSSSASASTGMKVTLTAVVTSNSIPAPGKVTFFNGGASLGTVTLDATGTASLDTTFTAAGVFTLTASYSGEGSITASVSAPLTETIVMPAVSVALNPGNLTVAAGSSGSLTLTLTSVGGYAGTISFSCGTLPAHVSCAFVPPSLTITSGSPPVTDTLTIRTSDATTARLELPGARGNRVLVAASFVPACLLLGFLGLRPRRSAWPSITMVILLFASLSLLSGCGGTSTVIRPGTYSIPITLQATGMTTQVINAMLIVK